MDELNYYAYSGEWFRKSRRARHSSERAFLSLFFFFSLPSLIVARHGPELAGLLCDAELLELAAGERMNTAATEGKELEE